MIDKIKDHPGKAATIASGGLSISVALLLFATKGEFEMLKARQSEMWRELQDVRLIMMKRADVTETNRLTVSSASPKVGQ